MHRTNRDWLPSYCKTDALLPKIPETRALFSWRPYLIQDFIGKAISYLDSDEVKRIGFNYDPRRAIPCRWKCSDESVFSVDLVIYAYTKTFPFDKGLIGGNFNTGSLAAAVHHGNINVDVGGSHVGYVPGDNGGTFGKIWRPAVREYSADCGHLMAVLAPFRKVYKDACDNILLMRPQGQRALVSIPNEYVQPTWSSERIKLLVDLENLTVGEVEYQHDLSHTHTLIGRSLFAVHDRLLDDLQPDQAREMLTQKPTPIGRLLTHKYFNIWDSGAELRDGLPRQRLLLYMKFILSARHSPAGLKAAVINTALEHNRLTDAVRSGAYKDNDFISFSGVFIDLYSKEVKSYVNLFQPMGMTIKPRGHTREIEFSPDQIQDIFLRMPVAEPRMPLEGILGHTRPQQALDSFTFEPGKFNREP